MFIIELFHGNIIAFIFNIFMLILDSKLLKTKFLGRAIFLNLKQQNKKNYDSVII